MQHTFAFAVTDVVTTTVMPFSGRRLQVVERVTFTDMYGQPATEYRLRDASGFDRIRLAEHLLTTAQ